MRGLTPEVVLDASLLQSMAALFDMDKLYGGDSVRRDERGWIVRDAHGQKVYRPVARSLWVAEVRPAHMETACLAVVTTRHRRMAGVVIETHPWVANYPPSLIPIIPPTLVQIGPVDLDADWHDPVATAIGRLEGWPHDQVWALDGRAYTLFAGTTGSRIALEFSNPVIPSLVHLEHRLVDVARLLVAHDATGKLGAYVDEWARYVQPEQ